MALSPEKLQRAKYLLAVHQWRRDVIARLLGELFTQQREVADLWQGGQRFLAICCSRRAGKTQLLARLIAISLILSGRNEWTCFAARTLSIAKDLIWSDLDAINERYGLGWEMSESTGVIETPTGAKFRLVGVDDKASIEKVRGKKYRLFVCDEASTYQDHLKDLIVSCIRPGLVDLQGSLILAGTPGYVLSGFWFDAATGKLPAYVHRHWTLKVNPHIRDAEQELADVRAEFNWTEDDPVYVREYLGEWRDDASALVYAFTRDRNVVQALPVPFDPSSWLVTMGCDFGMKDESAWVVLGSPEHDPRTYVLHASKDAGLLPDEVAKRTRELVERFKPVRLVGDSGGLGSPYVEEWNRRWAAEVGIVMQAAHKPDKLAGIQLVNGALRQGDKPGGLILLAPEAEELAKEIQHLPWLDQARTKEHPRYANHCADGMLYSFKEHRGYTHAAPVIEPEKPRWSESGFEARLRARQEREQAPWWEDAG